MNMIRQNWQQLACQFIVKLRFLLFGFSGRVGWIVYLYVYQHLIQSFLVEINNANEVYFKIASYLFNYGGSFDIGFKTHTALINWLKSRVLLPHLLKTRTSNGKVVTSMGLGSLFYPLETRINKKQ